MRLNRKIKIVVVEDEKYYNQLMTRYVTNVCTSSLSVVDDFEIKSYYTAHDVIEELEDDIDFMILDYYLINENENETDVLTAQDVIEEVKQHCPKCKIIVVSKLRNVQKAKEMLQAGIYGYVDKNVNSTNRVGALLKKALDGNAAEA